MKNSLIKNPMIDENDNKRCYENNILHRENGPAVENSDGSNE